MNKRNSLVDEIQELVITMIVERKKDGESINGDFIFSEGDLSDKFGVSRTTIREAIRSLEVRGFVERVHGKGIKLIDRSLDVVSRSLSDMLIRNGVNYAELLEVRRIIEVQAASLAALRATDEFEPMEKAIRTMEDKNVSYEAYIEADFEFHRLVVHATKNTALKALVKSYEFVFKDSILASTKPDMRPEISFAYHKKVFECIKNRDPDGASQAMKEHLNATERNLKHYNERLI